jgi:Uma2 family endonuclease
MSEPALKPMSVAEYLRTEPDSPVKREYVDGFVYPLHGQSGAGKAHVLISGNIYVALHASARQRGCRLYQSDMKLRIGSKNGGAKLFYPDVMAACGPNNVQDDFEIEPCLLIEVLSPSTAANDRLGKYNAYTALPSLQTYLLVEQTERYVHAFQRRGQEWELSEVKGAGQIAVPCLGHALSLEEMYDGVVD